MRIPEPVKPDVEQRLLLSRMEVESLKERDILCPICGYRIQRLKNTLSR